jgi:S-DNA-T family DNA segregation ATPase FtsK/SpoIIIE
MQTGKGFHLPLFSLLEDPDPKPASLDSGLRMQSKLSKKLEDFGVNGQVVAVSPAGGATMVRAGPGVKINKVANLCDDLAWPCGRRHRIVAPIPGKAAIGIGSPTHSGRWSSSRRS